MQLTQLTSWLTRKLNESDGDADYVTVSPQEGRAGRRPAYVQRGKVRVNGKPVPVVVDSVVETVREVADSRNAEGDPLRCVKLYVYGPKGETCIAEHVFVVNREAPEDEEEEPAPRGKRASATDARETELVLMAREHRIAAQSANEHLVRVTSGAMALAMKSIEENGELRKQLAETTGALIIAENVSKSDTAEMIEMVKPILPGVVQMVAMKLGGMGGGTP